MTDNTDNPVTFASMLLLFTILFPAAMLTLEACLSAHEHEQCHRLQRQADNGYPVDVPDWCAAYLFDS